jgi:hypothetical protein
VIFRKNHTTLPLRRCASIHCTNAAVPLGPLGRLAAEPSSLNIGVSRFSAPSTSTSHEISHVKLTNHIRHDGFSTDVQKGPSPLGVGSFCAAPEDEEVIRLLP